MKFKGKFKIGELEVPKTELSPEVKIKDVEIEYEGEYTLEEISGVYTLAKQMIQELPSIIEDLKNIDFNVAENTDEI